MTWAWAGLAAVFWWTGWRVARHLFKHVTAAWLWFLLFVGTTGITASLNIDVRLIAVALVLWMLHFFVEDRALSVMQALLALSLGWLSLVKCSVGVFFVVVMLTIAVDNVFRQRQFPWLLVVFGASLLTFWCVAGQRLSSLVPFIVNSTYVMNGYTEGMMETVPMEFWAVLRFLVMVALLTVLAGYAAWVRHRWFGITALVGFCFLLFTAFKYGFVRHDAHEVSASLELFLAAQGCAAISWPIVRGKGGKVFLVWLVPSLLAGALAIFTFSQYVQATLPAAYARTLSPGNLLGPAKLLGRRQAFLRAYQEYMAQIQTETPLPQLAGSVGIYPWNQAAVLAHGLRYSPQPVFQSYSAYTPELASLNVAHLRSDRAPDYILFQIMPIDHRFPSLDDGLSWPDLLTRYDVQAATGTFALLRKSTKPREYHLALLKDVPLHFAEPVAVPATTNGPIWARLEINKTLVGTVLSTLYKPPILTLAVSLRNGQQLYFRLVPGIARSGFLLSPLIKDSPSFVSLADREEGRNLSGLEVTSVAVFALTESGSTICYQSPMRLRCYRLEFPGQDLPQGGDSPH